MELRAGLPQVVGAGRCPASLGKNQVLSFLLLMVLLVWNWLEALEPRNFSGDPPSPSCRALAWAGEQRLCLHQQGRGLGAQGWCFPAGSTSSFPTEKLERGFVKDVASSQREQHASPGCWVQAGMCWDSSGRGSPLPRVDRDAHREPNPPGSPQITPLSPAFGVWECQNLLHCLSPWV